MVKDRPLEREEREILEDRIKRLRELGFTDGWDYALAWMDVPLEEIVNLVSQGCPPGLVTRIIV